MLTILNVAYSMAPVGPDAVGGAEQILSRLDFALVEARHHSLVVACQGSVTAGRLLATPESAASLDQSAKEAAYFRHREQIEVALKNWPIDLIHFHGVDFLNYLPTTSVPMLATLHLPPSFYPEKMFRSTLPNLHLHCVSRTQRRKCPPSPRLLPEIPNGVPVDLNRPLSPKEDYVLALGRICPEKGFHVALDVATRSRYPLVLGGEIFPYPEHQAYYETEICPRLIHPHRFLGRVAGKRKEHLLASARCLLVTSSVEETSSLVALEALAAGTPVIAFDRGALTEIVETGVTGFLVRDELEMAEAIREVHHIDPELCRRRVQQRFSLSQMIRSYFQFYRKLAGRNVFIPGEAEIYA